MSLYICRNCDEEFEETKMSEAVYHQKNLPKGQTPFYCTTDCFEESYMKLEKIWQKNNHNQEASIKEFDKEYPIKEWKKIEYR